MIINHYFVINKVFPLPFFFIIKILNLFLIIKKFLVKGRYWQKKFFLLQMNLEDEKMDFPPFLKKKKFLRLAHENQSRRGIGKKKFFFYMK